MFRLGAIALGLMPFLACEIVLQSTGWQSVDAVHDPFIGFTEIRPLFVPDESKTNYEISKSRLPLFQPDSFSLRKPDNEFRIFCIGGSTVQGRPFSIETAFSKWMELNLNATDPSKKWRVVNCGGVSYASYRLVPIVDEILTYQPDLIVLYTGHNEFLEDRTYESVKDTPAWIARSHERLSSIKTYSFIRSCVTKSSSPDEDGEPANTLPTEVEARLDFKDGLEQYTRDDAWKQKVVEHFELNLQRMVNSIQSANVPLIICNPTCDLRHSPPFKSQNSDDLSDEQIASFNKLAGEMQGDASSLEERTLEEEAITLKAMLEIDPRHAMTHFRMATVYDAQAQYELARKHFIQAKEQDICPLRATEPIYDVIARVSQPLDSVDVRSAFQERATGGISGRETLIDHVHPTIHGHQLIASMLVDMVTQMKLIKPPSNENLESEISRLHSDHLETLPFMYFQRGKDRLAGLKRWAAGEVTRERNTAEVKDKPSPK